MRHTESRHSQTADWLAERCDDCSIMLLLSVVALVFWLAAKLHTFSHYTLSISFICCLTEGGEGGDLYLMFVLFFFRKTSNVLLLLYMPVCFLVSFCFCFFVK